MAANLQNDTELWQLVKQDDRAAYEVLYLRYLDVIFIEIHQRVRQKTDAEDLVQDVFLSIWEKRNNITLEGRFFSYLYRAAQNRILNYYRDRKLPVEHIAVWEELREGEGSFFEQPAAFKAAASREMEWLLEEEKQHLPSKMRQVYELHYEKNMTANEIAEQLILSPNTVRNQLKEVRRRFTGVVKKVTFLLFDIFLLAISCLPPILPKR